MLIQLGQLAFNGILNGLYSGLLLMVIGIAGYQWWELRKSQSQWFDLWKVFENNNHLRIDELLEDKGRNLLPSLQAHYLGDLTAHLEVHQTLPPSEESSHKMLTSALSAHAILGQQEISADKWDRWPGVAILLGLLGTFVGLTAALIQLPFGGELQRLTDGLQHVLPLMGTAFWTSVCGLIASLVLRALHGIVSRYQKQRDIAYEQLCQVISQRLHRELYPHLVRQKLFIASREDAISDVLREFAENMRKVQQQSSRELAQRFDELGRMLSEQTSQIADLPKRVAPLLAQLDTCQQILQQWNVSLAQNTHQFGENARVINEMVAPIAHTERLLNERVSSLLRQQESIANLVDAIDQRERQLPVKMREILAVTLRPAYRSLQVTSQNIQQSVELLFERNSKEREAWRHELNALTERLRSIERLAQSADGYARELARITDQLSDLTSRIRLQPPVPITNQEQNQPLRDPLDLEIDQLLEEFDQLPSNHRSGQ
jgi:ABC-type transporter Mla subunit MlaD